MEIITKKHWLGWNSDDKEVSDWAMKSSDENFKIYAKRLEKLRPRLKERNYQFSKTVCTTEELSLLALVKDFIWI